MSYQDKIHNYQGDCKIIVGDYEMFSDYIKSFVKYCIGHGLDIGAGPGGCNSAYFAHRHLDGCDADSSVVKSLKTYSNTFEFVLGQQILPYLDNSLDYIICSCVIQHLKNYAELMQAIGEISRVLKPDGEFYLMFKVGTNDTDLVHTNSYYNEQRTFRVFHPNNVTELLEKNKFTIRTIKHLLDDNYIPYCCIHSVKN